MLEMDETQKDEKTVLTPEFGGGPHGLGDPNDKRLRKVEIEVLIPKLMRERAKVEKCTAEVSAFETCCKASGFLMVVKCRNQTENLTSCLTKWYQDKGFVEECTKEYLAARSKFRATGKRSAEKRIS